ncbi:MAG: ATP-dependent DNA helicase RecG, partial [Thermodesulfobacteriota bacterium]
MAINIQRLWAILAALNKPLRFAVNDGFAHLHTLKGLEAMAEPLLEEALVMMEGRGGDIKGPLIELRDIFRGIDSCTIEDKKSRINKALSLTGPSMEKRLIEAASENIRRLSAPLGELKGVGPKVSGKLAKKGLKTVFDVLFYLPRRYEDRSRLRKIRDLTPGEASQTVAAVAAAGEGGYGRRKIFEVVVDDGSSLLHLKWFHYRAAYVKRFTPGQRLLIHGLVVRSGYSRGLEIIHPDIEFIGDDEAEPSVSHGILAIYPEIEGLHQKALRKIIAEAVKGYASLAPGGVPPEVLAKRGFKDLPSALMEAHFPTSMPHENKGSAGAPGMADLAFDELFLLEMAMQLKRLSMKKKKGLRSYGSGDGSSGLEGRLRKLLPFSLTRAQESVLREIKHDMAGSSPMNRLLEGDVGCGKTVVSLIAALLAVDSAHQAAIMAPTSLLAEQHYSTISSYAERLGLKTCLLLGGLSAKEREGRLREIRDGEADIIVGTHALIQEDVHFKSLGLVVVDEQHRFGVLQRAELSRKGALTSCEGGEGEAAAAPDVLIMTATPIPRTLSMTIFGNLEVSVIDEMPPGRRPVKTRLIGEKGRESAYNLIRREVRGGAQAYIVYPLVEESEELDLKDATQEKERLASDVFAGLRIGLVHGRMSGADKDGVMRDFKDGKIDILVATTVIEVGLDVPGATVMLIEHAERFGLAQLHQLRGRVGRGERESYCVLIKNTFAGEDSY